MLSDCQGCYYNDGGKCDALEKPAAKEGNLPGCPLLLDLGPPRCLTIPGAITDANVAEAEAREIADEARIDEDGL